MSAQRGFGPRDVDALPSSAPTRIARYGSHELAFGELRMPSGTGPFPVAVVIHGGCWTVGFATLKNTAPLASALTDAGVATWNIEYRQVGDPGAGWPGTFLDVGAGVDYLRTLAETYPIDLARVTVIGHSAGAHLALWSAGRAVLPAESPIRGPNPLKVAAAVAIDGPADVGGLVGRDADICGKPVIAPLMGGTPAEQPARYRDASPQEMLPLRVPQYLVAAAVLTHEDARRHEARGRAAGDTVVVLPVTNGNHFDVIGPGRAAFPEVLAFIRRAMALQQ
ncbi:alpha/beta hydrolase [Luteitalea sp. TBR-22]|uniref:alpha/beta hydrolase n=1 Tax=Luteitalea sp. TBR-22 TaxID=2802971 RepID=UPI001EF56E9A|nr:alpha/beta hydrolase [Luteitalea sp. TBR-22]